MRTLRTSLYSHLPIRLLDSSAAALVVELICCHAGSSAGLRMHSMLGLELDILVSAALTPSSTILERPTDIERAVALRTLLTRRHT